jgi:hypothetical protein
VATSVPDDLLNWAGKLIFTIIAAAIGAVVSHYVNAWLNRK